MVKNSGKKSNKSADDGIEHYYDDIEKDQRCRYAEFVGVDPNNRSNAMFTEDEQISRHARNLAFWFIEMGNSRLQSVLEDPNVRASPSSASYRIMAHHALSSHGLKHIRGLIHDKFERDVIERIYRKSQEIVESQG